MRTATKVTIGVSVSVVVIIVLLGMAYVGSISSNIDKQVENLPIKYGQDFSKEIEQYPSYRVISEVLSEPNVKEKYRQYLEALNSGSESEANNMYESFKNYVETRAETKFRQEYPLESFAGNLSELIFGKQ